MRILAAATLTLLPLAATAAQPEAEPPTPSPATEQPAAPEKPRCDRFARIERAGDGAVLQAPPARAQRLGELPAGDLHLTVERVVDGCREAVIVRQGYGLVREAPAGR